MRSPIAYYGSKARQADRIVALMPAHAGYIEPCLETAIARLARVSIECRPAIEVIDQYGAAASNLLYVDPPYLGQTRRGWDRYSHDLRTEHEHAELAEHLHVAAATVMLSGYPSPLYDQLYDDWDHIEIPAFSGHGADRARTEVLWANRALGAYLFDLEREEPTA